MPEYRHKKQYLGIKIASEHECSEAGSRFKIESECNWITVKLAFYVNPRTTFSDKSAE